jgi:hypothetical protein
MVESVSSRLSPEPRYTWYAHTTLTPLSRLLHTGRTKYQKKRVFDPARFRFQGVNKVSIASPPSIYSRTPKLTTQQALDRMR